MITSVSLPARTARMTSSCPSRRARKPKVWRRVRRRVENWTVSAVMELLPGLRQRVAGIVSKGRAAVSGEISGEGPRGNVSGGVAYKGGAAGGKIGVPGRLALITPALFSRPPPRPPGEEGEVSLARLEPLSPVRSGGRLGERGWGVRVSPEGAAQNPRKPRVFRVDAGRGRAYT